MDVHELRHQADIDSKTVSQIYNPDTEDFTVNYHGKPYTIYALEIAEFPTPIANHIKKHLADRLLNKRGIRSNPQNDLERFKQEIAVE